MGLNQQLFSESKKYIPGGVNSPARSFRSVGGNPLFIKKAKGSKIYDEEGNEFIDYVGSWGPMIFGHADDVVVRAIQKQAENSSSFGAPTELELEMSKKVCELTGVDKVRFVNSGTEATMTAIRIARAYTGRDKVIKFEGCYHGHADPFLVKAGSGASTLGAPDSPGVIQSVAKETLNAEFNNLDSVKSLVDSFKNEVACVILEPVAGNMGCVPPKDGFLEGIRKLCDENNIVLILDEVMTGFRLAAGGAQELYGIKADLATYGKIIGGGLPVGAVGGKHELMDCLSPVGAVYQAGTLSGNPLAMTAGLTTLNKLNKNTYTELEQKSVMLERGIQKVLKETNIDFHLNRVGSMLTLFFTPKEVSDFNSAKLGDNEQFKKFFHNMLDNGIYLPPSPYECWFISQAHTEKDIEKTIEAVRKSV